MSKKNFALFFILFSGRLVCQDTISVLFKTGYSKLENKEAEKLDIIPLSYDLTEADSVHFVGMADSVGKINANLKLSEKRAQQVEKYCKKFISEKIPVRVSASGEATQSNLELNRCVYLIIYSKTKKSETIELPGNDSIPSSENFSATATACYDIDYEVLHHCHLRLVTKGKKEFIVIETEYYDWKKLEKLFFADFNKAGKIIVKPLRWKNISSGSLWWGKNRNTAIVPREGFKKFKLFRKHPLPCGDCSETFKIDEPLKKVDTCFQVDYFLMYNLQIKIPFFLNRPWINARVPREYVDISVAYYIGCKRDWRVRWAEKSGRKNKKYYFTRLPLRLLYVENITRYMDCCSFNPEPSECDRPFIGICPMAPPDKSLMLIFEPGYYYQFQKNLGYALIGLSKTCDYSHICLLSGIDSDRNWYSLLRYQFYFLNFPFKIAALSWQTPSKASSISRYGRFFVGTEIRAIAGDAGNYYSQSVHVGLACVNYGRLPFFQRIFVQYGLSLDYAGNYSHRVFPLLEAGINFKLLKF